MELKKKEEAAKTATTANPATLAQRVMKAATTFGPHGRLYEVDSRLRPSGKSGAAAISLAAFEQYFAEEGPAATWERQALTKARVVVGSQAARKRAAAIIGQAAYGHTWDAAAIQAIRQMRSRMEQGAATSNLKRGPGGVVDIEFVVQMLQLVHGGEDASLRTTETLAGLVHVIGSRSRRAGADRCDEHHRTSRFEISHHIPSP